MTLKRDDRMDGLFNADTMLKALVGEERDRAQRMFDDLVDGKHRGVLFMIRVDDTPIPVRDGEDGAHVEGVSMVNGLPVAAGIRAMVDQHDLSITDVVSILENTRTEGTVITR